MGQRISRPQAHALVCARYVRVSHFLVAVTKRDGSRCNEAKFQHRLAFSLSIASFYYLWIFFAISIMPSLTCENYAQVKKLRLAVVLASRGSRKSYSPKVFDHKWRVTAYQLEEDWNWRLLMQLRCLVCYLSPFSLSCLRRIGFTPVEAEWQNQVPRKRRDIVLLDKDKEEGTECSSARKLLRCTGEWACFCCI